MNLPDLCVLLSGFLFPAGVLRYECKVVASPVLSILLVAFGCTTNVLLIIHAHVFYGHLQQLLWCKFTFRSVSHHVCSSHISTFSYFIYASFYCPALSFCLSSVPPEFHVIEFSSLRDVCLSLVLLFLSFL